MARTSIEALAQVLAVLAELEIPYLLVGSFSSNFYSYPRATNDADIELQFRDGDLTRIWERLGPDFIVDPQTSFEMLTGTLRDVITFRPTKFDIEFYRLGNDPHLQERFARRKQVALPELSVAAVLPTAEDVVIQKLRWQREKDIDDVRKVLAIQYDKLDWEYISKWTAVHGTSELLGRLRMDAEDQSREIE